MLLASMLRRIDHDGIEHRGEFVSASAHASILEGLLVRLASKGGIGNAVASLKEVAAAKGAPAETLVALAQLALIEGSWDRARTYVKQAELVLDLQSDPTVRFALDRVVAQLPEGER